jgi:integrase
MSKERRGCIVEKNGRIYVRVQYTDQLGKRRELMRRATDRKHARQLQKELVKQLDSAEQGNQRPDVDARKITFAKVAAAYEAVKLIPAQYVADKKVAGLRSLKAPKIYLKRLVEHFGAARIHSLTYSAVDAYRLQRLQTGLSIASVNRELALLRSIFNFAKQEWIITRTPFEMGEPLICLADETKRSRVLRRDEEERLLLAFSGDSPRAHLRPLVIASLDSGARKNELLTLRWSDVSIEGGVITLRAFNTKSARARQIPISARLKDELQRIRSAAEPDSEALVFDARSLQKHFQSALLDAGIDDFRWHDMRHSFASRLAHSGMSISELAALLGHSQIQTTLRYANATAETIQKATDILNDLNAGDSNKAEGEDKPELIN